MEKNKFKKGYTWVTIFFIIVISFVYFSINKGSHPFEPINKMRDRVKNYEFIATKKTENGTMVYSVGEVNSRADNMYFVDMVKKSLVGYKWLGGGGHINSDIKESKDFLFSAQLLNENQNINPTLFGIFFDEKIREITVRTIDELAESTIYDGKDKCENFYVIPFTRNVSEQPFFIFAITYEDGKRLENVITKDKASEFQEGKAIYFYEKDMKM